MKTTFFLVFLILFQSCSFDNRLGIWQNINETDTEKQDLKGLKSLSLSEKQFDEIIPFDNKYKFNLTKPIIVSSWKDIYYNQSNNLENLNYRELNQIKYKSKKISRNISSTNILLESGNIIFSDLKGNIIVFSLDENKIIEKFNFYKKKYKKLNKSINMIVEDNIIYVSDNFGYLYAYNYKNKRVLWAKNYKIPFRSNLKIFNELDLYNDIEACMGLLKNLDLFITVSNSTAHFAGALGIPTILICPKKSSTYYYWNTNSGSSIWYKNIKVLGIESSISETIEQINNIVEKNNEFSFSN